MVIAPRCAPIVRAFGASPRIGDVGRTPTIADGLRVPKAIGDFLVLRAVREGGTALAVGTRDGSHEGARPPGRHQRGAWKAVPPCTLCACSPTKGALPHDTVVIFNTGGALKYSDLLG